MNMGKELKIKMDKIQIAINTWRQISGLDP